ncbi:MAG: DUF3043 domain-containing protein [Aurantimicrobium sp.]|nr:DUF3043 domain-containing protein [Aurantimicrobium sp.]
MSKNNVESRSEATPETPVAGKGHATPTRKEREAANKRPLVPEDRAEARRQNRASVVEQRERARIGMAAGDERYLPARDRGPQKRYVRDYVDARYSVGELTIPFMVLVILTSFYQPLMEIGVIVMWSYLIIVIVDCYVMTYRLRQRLKTKFGSSERGVSWYASMRSIQFRTMRMPKPAVRRRQYPS